MRRLLLPILPILLLILLTLLTACDQAADTALSAEEISAAATLLPENAGALSDITAEAMAGIAEKFPAARKVHRAENGDYIIIATAIGYNGPLTVLVAIDSARGQSYGIRILRHLETEHYVRDFDSGDWFTARFAGKSVKNGLHSVYLEAQAEDEIISITGSTQATDAVILAVNTAFAIFCEHELGQTAAAVPDSTDPDDYVEIILPQ